MNLHFEKKEHKNKTVCIIVRKIIKQIFKFYNQLQNNIC